MRGVFSSPLRWLNSAVFGSRRSYFRPEQAEFLVTHQTFVDRPFRGRWVTGCASIDALRSTNNSVNIEETHEISFIRETFAPFARRIPPKGRSPGASSGHASDCSQENLLAATCSFFHQRQHRQKTGRRQWSQWFAATAAA